LYSWLPKQRREKKLKLSTKSKLRKLQQKLKMQKKVRAKKMKLPTLNKKRGNGGKGNE
jgi:hypothetical protein